MDATAFLTLNGRVTDMRSVFDLPMPYSVNPIEHAPPSSTENNANNAWNINFSSGQVNNNNNKNNGNSIKAVVALDEETKEGWIAAFHDCCRKKKSSTNCNDYRSGDWETDLWLLVAEVYSRTYYPKTSTCFIVTRPTYREVFAADFRDRIVQHWICIRLEPLFEERFKELGNKSHNCRKGFGTTSAILALERDIRDVSENYTKDAWISKIDIQSFFMSIDVDILWDLLEKFIKERYKGDDIDTLLYLTEITARHRPQNDCFRKSPIEFWKMLAPHKSLFTRGGNSGIAIGNITSQQEANFYMSHYVEAVQPMVDKAGARIEQFVDDIPCVAPNKKFCIEFRKHSERILKEKLGLRLHPKKFYLQHVKKGVKFVGEMIMPGRRYVSNRTLGHFVDRLRHTEKLCRNIIEGGITEKRLLYLRHAVSSLNSYLGFMVHNQSYRMRRKIFKRECKYFWKVCYTRNFSIVKTKNKYDFRIYLITKEIEDYDLELFSNKTGRSGCKKPPRNKAKNYKFPHRRNFKN